MECSAVFAEVLVTFTSLRWPKVNLTLSKQLHSLFLTLPSVLQGGYLHHFRFQIRETRAKEVKWLFQIHKIVWAGARIRSQVGLTPNPIFFTLWYLIPLTLGVITPTSRDKTPVSHSLTDSWIVTRGDLRISVFLGFFVCEKEALLVFVYAL